MGKNIIVLGTESSGSTLIAVTIARALGIENYEGRQWSEENEKEDKVCHNSLPAGKEIKEWPNIDKFALPNRSFVLCTRDKNCIILAEKSQGIKAATEQNEKAKKIMTKFLETERCFIWSYETFMFLEDAYLKILYNFLGINSTYMPKLKDGNEKYIIPFNLL